MSIGAFSKLSNITSKTLRYYDEIGLVKPAYINNENGYRYYDTEQLKTILLINKLKMYCFSLEEITEILKAGTEQRELAEIMKQKQFILYEKINQYNYASQQLNKDIENLKRGIDIMAYLDEIKVGLVETKPMNILSVRVKMNVEEYGKYMGVLFEKIAKDHLTVIGAPVSIYHDEEYNPESYDIEIGVPIKEIRKDTRELPGTLCASATLKGSYTQLSSVYAKIKEWIDDNGYEAYENNQLPHYEVYLTNPANTAPENFLTEVYVPVKKSGQ